MGNGPSLNDTIATHGTLLRENQTMAVNFAANASVFRDIKPRFYVLADPYFFSSANYGAISKRSTGDALSTFRPLYTD